MEEIIGMDGLLEGESQKSGNIVLLKVFFKKILLSFAIFAWAWVRALRKVIDLHCS